MYFWAFLLYRKTFPPAFFSCTLLLQNDIIKKDEDRVGQ